MRRVVAIAVAFVLGAAFLAHTVSAQNPPLQHPPKHGDQMPMPPGSMHDMHHPGATAGAPVMPGQDAFGAIAEVVRLLDADSKTDWSQVNLERLRQHLIDMNEVVLHAQIAQTEIPGGLAMDVAGAGRAEQAIRAMLVPHATELDRMPAYSAKAEPIPGGVRLTVTAKNADDAKAVARLRALGFVGLLTEGGHHGPHHLAMAKGEALPGHAH